ncbi:MAG: beta-ketoacyl-[acyl-carrier-protein] synthase family protein [Spirochaetes bacterium]|nr:beta-ketoacyl-[acyl-carrier-protein] synthase family protein [Spirochaetota bacterium]
MSGGRIFVTGMGIVSPLGRGVREHLDSLKQNRSGINPLSLFPASPGNVLPAGEIRGFTDGTGLPRTHEFALAAAREALAGREVVPDAVIIGTTTGGMPLTESLLKQNERRAELYRYHSTSSVAEKCAETFACNGPVITVTNACSSGSAAIKLACELLRSGRARRVLAGGADALCRLTYYGFNSLQLIDPAGARPLDRSRRGMTVAEGAAMLLLEAGDAAPDGALAEIMGGGLSCDAHHPASPHPEGAGALAAMKAALADAAIDLHDIDYINLHGTGTVDNDLSEAKAVRALFGKTMPPLSSIKGATGHSLAASGAIEAVVSAIAIREGIIPATTGCAEPDPSLELIPVLEPMEKKTGTILSNSFGFGGNNACLVLGNPEVNRHGRSGPASFRFEILGSACITGAGDLDQTIAKLKEGCECSGILPVVDISKNLPAREVRRLKRLPRLALALALGSRDAAGSEPASVFFGTSWGPLSETNDFLTGLYESGEQFTSPTDFVGSVHNAPAGQAAIWLKATGPNITATGGDRSFEEALLAAALTAAGRETLLVMAADEHHEILSPLFDPSVSAAGLPADGGGALCLRKTDAPSGMTIIHSFYERARGPGTVSSLISALGGTERIRAAHAALFAGIPAAERAEGEKQLADFISRSGFSAAIIDYRPLIGEFGSASAAAAAIATRLMKDGSIPASLAGGSERALNGKGILMLGLGTYITAIELIS